MQTLRRLWLLGLLAFLFAAPAVAQLPEGYRVSRQFGKPCRIDTLAFPWRVASSDTRFSSVVEHAVATWNAESLRLGLGQFFKFSQTPESAQLVIDWSGQDLPGDKAGGVFWDANLGYKRVLKVSMDGGHRVPQGNRAEILMQELGHVLGLGDSSEPSDIMYPIMRTRRLARVSRAGLSQRDKAAITWLYSQPEWVPILAPAQLLRPPEPATPEPSFTPHPPAPAPLP